jgi:hypothetical protein
MIRICPHNYEVDCGANTCDRCGWNPEVAKKRLQEAMKTMSDSKLYKVAFTGYCEVWANSQEEAADLAEDAQNHFFAHYDYDDPECLYKEEENELD